MPASVDAEFMTQPDAMPKARIVVPWIDADADLSAGRATYQCSLDQWQALASDDGRFRMSGWFADVAGRTAPATVEVVFQGAGAAWAITVTVDRARPDVAAYFDVETIKQSGFASVVDAGLIPNGEYAVHLQAEVGGRILRCRTTNVISMSGRISAGGGV